MRGIFNSALIGRMRARLNRVWGVAGMIMGTVNIGTFAMVQRQFTGISVPLMAAGVVSVLIGVPVLFVYCEERFGWWGEESLHICKLTGYDPVEMAENIKEIKERLNRLEPAPTGGAQ